MDRHGNLYEKTNDKASEQFLPQHGRFKQTFSNPVSLEMPHVGSARLCEAVVESLSLWPRISDAKKRLVLLLHKRFPS